MRGHAPWRAKLGLQSSFAGASQQPAHAGVEGAAQGTSAFSVRCFYSMSHAPLPLQEPGESEAAAMVRILALPSEYMLRTAANVDAAREQLFAQNDAVIAGMLKWPGAGGGEASAAGTLDQETD